MAVLSLALPILAAPQPSPPPVSETPPPSRSAVCDRITQSILRGQYAAALQQIEGAKSPGSAPADLENLRGLALLLSGKTERAIASFDRALTLDASLGEARYNRALALLHIGESAKAAADLEKIYADPNSSLRADAAYHEAIALDRLGRSAEAETWLDRARALDPTLDSALLYSGYLRERRGDLQGAGRAYLAYLETHPDSPIALLRFGISAHVAGREDVAKRYLDRVVAVAPDSDEAVEARKFLVMWE